MNDTPVPVIVIDDSPVKLRGVCEFVAETPRFHLRAGVGGADAAILLVERLCQELAANNPTLAGWMVLSDLHLGTDNGVRLGRKLLEIAPGLRVVIYTQDPSWTLAVEIFRQEYARGARGSNKRASKSPGLHGYALFGNMEPAYLERITTTVVSRHETFIDPEVLNYLLKKLRGQRLTPRQEECAVLISQGLSNDEIALSMGFLNAQGKPNMGPLENMVSELYLFFAIEGAPSDPGRRVLLAHLQHLIASDPTATKWHIMLDNLNIYQSEALVRWMTQQEGIGTETLGVKGKSGILQSMESRAAFLHDPTHRVVFYYTPQHASWMNQVEIWLSILVRKLLKRGNFLSLDDLRDQILAFIAYYNRTMAKPIKWTYTGLA